MSKPRHTHESFTLLAIEKLQAAPPPSRGKSRGRVIHTVFSGFNAAFRQYFKGECPIQATQQLLAAGKISMRLVKGGAIIAAPGVIPPKTQRTAQDLLGDMGLGDDEEEGGN